MCELSIVIVNYNTCDLLLGCLRSVYEALGSLEAEVWVVDNASADGSVEIVQSRFPQSFVIANEENLGFARANNIALRMANGNILVILNPDTLVFKDTFIELLKAFQENINVGMVAPQLQNADGTIQPSFGQFASSWTEFNFQFFLYKFFPSPYPLGYKIHPLQQKKYNTAHSIEWASGACLALRSDVAKEVGLLDETIFMYGEDMEWCYRVKQAGYINWFLPKSKVIHLVRQSSKRNYTRWIENYTRGNLGFVRSYGSQFSTRMCGFWVIVGSILRIIIWAGAWVLFPRMRIDTPKRISGYFRALHLGWQALIDKTS